MNKKPTIKIGIVGLGVVGQGVWKHIKRNRPALERRLGVNLVLHKAAVRDLSKKRDVNVNPAKLTDDPMAVATDPEIDIVCELMGGTDTARDVTMAAFEQGKTVVTANKALICHHGAELFAAAARGGGHYFFEASVAGGIPIIKSIREGLAANRFPVIYGILNGTCNYILTRMAREGATFDTIVKDARRLGYVEADESLDLDGWDTAHKAIILAYLAHGKWFPLKDITVEGIGRITLDDLLLAQELGDYKVKLLAVITRDFDNNRVSIRVQPMLIHRHKVLARVDGVYNGVSVTGDVVGTTVHIGRGAGQDATASAVIGDIVDAIATRLGLPPTPWTPEETPFAPINGDDPQLATLSEIPGKFYFRMTVADKPGVLSDITAVFARNGVSIESVRQQPRPETTSSLILTTHDTNEQYIQDTLGELERLDALRSEPFILRVADFEE